jgi:hypothetical protein
MDSFITVVPDKAKDIYHWMNWLCTSNQPFNFVANPTVRAYSKLGSISVATLKKYMLKTKELVVKKIAEDLKDKIVGLIFDGWSEDSSHFVALVACYEGKDDNATLRLLAVAPLLNESDFGAESHREYIDNTLLSYGLTTNSISFIVGDNCNTNKSLARLMNKPLIGCASHRFNLAVKSFCGPDEALLTKLNSLMSKLRTLKNSARLRQHTTLTGRKRNATRWSSTYEMLKR